MDTYINVVKKGAIGVLFLGIIAYALLVLAYVFRWHVAIELLGPKPGFTFGLPICAITSFAIVSLLETQSEGEKKSEKLNFKAFGLDFTGPASSVTLWVVCYLTLVASMRIVP